MKYKILSFFLVLSQLTVLPVGRQTAYAAVRIPITASSAILMENGSSRILYSKTPHLKRQPASTTKLLTAIVALEQLGPEKIATVPAYATSVEPSKIYLRRGERYRVKDLIRAILLNSANDAAEALAYNGGGNSRERFIILMNKKAKALGCKKSNFANPSGLPNPRQYSTAYDMSLIMRETQRYPFLVETMKVRTINIRSTRGRKIALRSHNKMLWRAPESVFGKTGWTRKARHCFVGLINGPNNRKVFVAMLGSHRLWGDLKTLVDYQFGTSLYRANKTRTNWAVEDRKKIQLALKRAGYRLGAIDGQFGPKTIRAIRSFQKAHGISATGFVGAKTRAKLEPYF